MLSRKDKTPAPPSRGARVNSRKGPDAEMGRPACRWRCPTTGHMGPGTSTHSERRFCNRRTAPGPGRKPGPPLHRAPRPCLPGTALPEAPLQRETPLPHSGARGPGGFTASRALAPHPGRSFLAQAPQELGFPKSDRSWRPGVPAQAELQGGRGRGLPAQPGAPRSSGSPSPRGAVSVRAAGPGPPSPTAGRRGSSSVSCASRRRARPEG